MRYVLPVAVTFLVTACSLPSSPAPEVTGSVSARLSSSASTEPAVAKLLAFGSTITAAQAASYVADVPSFGADESIDALSLLAIYADSGQDNDAVEPIANALRAHVEGLRIPGMTVDGMSISFCGGTSAVATFNPNGASYAGVSIAYSSTFAWTTALSSNFTLGSDGLYHATLDGLDPQGEIVYALDLQQLTGGSLWLNNPRENSPGAVEHLNYEQRLALCIPALAPSETPWARLLQSFATPESLGGTAVVEGEFDWFVAQFTWEGIAPDDPAVVQPTVAALDAMNASGVQFVASYSSMRSFIQTANAPMRLTSTTAVDVQRNDPNQSVQVTAPLGSRWMRVYYSTDGWETPKVVECTPSGRLGYVSCLLGYLPPDVLVSFSAIVEDASGNDESVHASDGGNVFMKVP